MELTAREDPATTPTGPGPVVETKSGGGTLNIAVECATREAVEKALAQSNGNVAEAAAALGILRTSLYRIMKRYGIAAPSCSKGRSQT